MKKFAFHIFDEKDRLRYAHADYIPCVGDEIRLGLNSEIFRVLKIVHCWDEQSSVGDRVNMKVKRIKP